MVKPLPSSTCDESGPKNPKPNVANTKAELARGCNRSQNVVSRWPKHAEWDQSPEPPWDIDQANRWAAEHLMPAPPRGRPVTKEGRKLAEVRRDQAVARTKLLRLDLQERRGDLVSRSEVEEGQVRRVHAARAALERLPRELASRLVGAKEEEIEAALRDSIEACLWELAGGKSE